MALRSPSATNLSNRERLSNSEWNVLGDCVLEHVSKLSFRRNKGAGWLTDRKSYLTTEDGPAQQSVSNGLIVADRPH